MNADPDPQPCYNYTPSTHIRVSQYVPNFHFFNVFILKQAHLHPKVTKQANFRGSLQNSRAKVENCANFFARSCTKTVKDREPIFCSNVIWSKYFKKVFHVYLNKKSNFYDIKLRKTLV